MCNQVPSEMCFPAPFFDILGDETDWRQKGQWTPMPVEHMFYRRAMVYHKPYCFLLNTTFQAMSRECVKRYMKRSILMDTSAGCFSPGAYKHWCFKNPENYNRDRVLFKKYYPLCNELCEAGWESVPHARADEECIQVERFGMNYLAVLNDSRETKNFTLALTYGKSCRSVDLVTGKE